MLTAMTAVDNIINGRRESARLQLPFQDSSRAPAPVSSGHRGANCIRLARRPNITCYHLFAAVHRSGNILIAVAAIRSSP